MRLGSRGGTVYDIVIGLGLLSSVPRMLNASFPSGKMFLITDANVSRRYGRKFHRSLVLAGAQAVLFEVPAGEDSKNHKVAHSLQTRLLENGVHRDSLVIALGGGVVGDLAGYVAATILRGVKYIHIPTTLLAQVDSSIGGKVGINHPMGKNLIGAFHQPSAVFIDPGVLRTLSAMEFRNGLAEVVKIAAALDEDFFEQLERRATRLKKENSTGLADIIKTAVGLKAGIVERDEKEHGIRKVLNLGHTLGHAIEAATKYTVPHGQAVAMGMVAEAMIARKMGLLKHKDYVRLVKLLACFRLPVRFPRSIDKRRFLEALALDKKSDSDGTGFVLLKSIGHSVIGVDVPRAFIEALL